MTRYWTLHPSTTDLGSSTEGVVVPQIIVPQDLKVLLVALKLLPPTTPILHVPLKTTVPSHLSEKTILPLLLRTPLHPQKEVLSLLLEKTVLRLPDVVPLLPEIPFHLPKRILQILLQRKQKSLPRKKILSFLTPILPHQLVQFLNLKLLPVPNYLRNSLLPHLPQQQHFPFSLRTFLHRSSPKEKGRLDLLSIFKMDLGLLEMTKKS